MLLKRKENEEIPHDRSFLHIVKNTSFAVLSILCVITITLVLAQYRGTLLFEGLGIRLEIRGAD